jgi:tripartite-type tricarboxylate transporter receptor subunit TctC
MRRQLIILSVNRTACLKSCAMMPCRALTLSFARPTATCLAIIAGLGALSLDKGRAEDYPARPVRIVVGYGPGASGDIVARIMAQALSKHFNRQFTIENRTGAGSALATT